MVGIKHNLEWCSLSWSSRALFLSRALRPGLAKIARAKRWRKIPRPSYTHENPQICQINLKTLSCGDFFKRNKTSHNRSQSKTHHYIPRNRSRSHLAPFILFHSHVRQSARKPVSRTPGSTGNPQHTSRATRAYALRATYGV